MAQTPVAPPQHDLVFEELPMRWDEAIPLGNGAIGALIWAEGDWLRFSLDRADLWDKRPVEEFQRPEFTFEWMYERVLEGDIASVQELIDRPYDRDPAPTKIPAGRLEFDRTKLVGEVDVRLRLADALCVIHWSGGARLTAFTHATEPIGWFHLFGEDDRISPPHIDPPPFTGDVEEDVPVNSLSGHDLRRLEYPAPIIEEGENSQTYIQQGWGDFRFAIHVEWLRLEENIQGVWSVASSDEAEDPVALARQRVRAALERGLDADYQTHRAWWTDYWRQSYITLPDRTLEAQWYREIYKFGCVARRGAPPISLQAVWTADERRIPPWKGDYHHDLNTQLSYWPCYSANRLEEGLSFLDWLWEIKPNVERWTRDFYGHGGLNVPGMSTIEGEPMGGWNQYSCSPTSAAWLAHHFYLHWRYSMDREFLAQRAYPWLREAARFIELHSVVEEGARRFPLSSSPEIHDNRLEAWFTKQRITISR